MKKLLSVLLCLVLLSGLFSVSAESIGSNQEPPVSKIDNEQFIPCDATLEDDFVAGEILIGIKAVYSQVNKVWLPSDFSESIGITAIEDLTYAANEQEMAVYNETESFNQLLKLYLSTQSKQSVLSGIDILEEDERILFAQPNFIREVLDEEIGGAQAGTTRGAMSLNSSTRFKNLTNDPMLKDQTGIFFHNVDKVWNGFTVGSRDVIVGIVDSGIAPHVDLVNNLVTGYDCINQTNDPNHTAYNDPHGTRVASIVGATGNNNKGITGVCQRVSLKSFFVGHEANTTTDIIDECVAHGILKAHVSDVKVLNMSIKSFVYDAPIVVTCARMFTGLIVVSAGNDAQRITQNNAFSAIYGTDNVIVVGAMTTSKDIIYKGFNSDGKEEGSNFSPIYVDLMALGEASDLVLCDLEDSYTTAGWGTSLSAPLVSGVAALLYSYNSSLTAAQVKQYILNGAATAESLEEYCVNGRYLDAYGAFLAMQNASTNSIKLAVFPKWQTIEGDTYFATRYEMKFTYEKAHLKLTEVDLSQAIYNDFYNSYASNCGLTVTSVDDNTGKTHVTVDLRVVSNVAQEGLPLIEFHFITYGNADTAMSKITVQSMNFYNGFGEEMTITTGNLYQKLLAGDANGDGVVTNADYQLILSHTVGSATLTGNRLIAADVADDFNVTARDAMWVQSYCLGNIKSLY